MSAPEHKAEDIVCLVVDDDEDDACLVDAVLRDIAGLDAATCWEPDCDLALASLATQHYAICLVDYRIGSTDGIAFVAEATRRGTRVPLILMTGDPDPAVDARAADAGAVDFIAKDDLTPKSLGRAIRFAMAQREKADALADERLRLQQALDHTRHGIAMFDADRHLIACNARYLEIYGFSASVVRPGKRLDDILRYSISLGNYTQDEAERIVDERLYQVALPKRSSYEQRLRDGRTISISHTPVAGGGSVTTCEDITETLARQKRTASLAHSAALSEAVAASKSKFLANMSHELRTPLNAIIGFNDVLRHELFGPIGHANYRDYSAHIDKSARELSGLVERILDMSLIGAGELQLDETDFAPAAALTHIADRYAAAAARKGVTLGLAANDAGLRLLGDRTKVVQAVEYIVDNAVKFCRPNGAVVLSLERCEDGGATIKVSDTGIGIAAEHIEALTSPFEQAEGSYARLNHGLGLGLPIAISLSAPAARFPLDEVAGVADALRAVASDLVEDLGGDPI